MEGMRENNQNPVSSWPLFKYMTFLEGHIRPRKSYKMMMKEMMYRQSGENCDTERGGYDSDDRTHSDDDTNDNIGGMIYKGNEQYSDDQPSIDENNVTQFMVPEINLPPPPPMKRRRFNDDLLYQNQFSQYSTSSEILPRVDKFNRFGQFVASSLADLPEEQALNLIEKFTSDIVSNLKSNLSN